MSLAERGRRIINRWRHPEDITNEKGEVVLKLVGKEVYDPDRRAVTAEGLLTSLYNLIFYGPKEEVPFERDEEEGIVDPGYEDGKVVSTLFLTTAFVYLNSRRNLDGSLREKPRTVIEAEVEFFISLNAFDHWGSDVYRSTLKGARIYVVPDLEIPTKSALQKLDKLRRGEPI